MRSDERPFLAERSQQNFSQLYMCFDVADLHIKIHV